MADFKLTLHGIDEFRAKMRGMGNDMAGILEEATNKGALVVVKAAQENSKKGGYAYPHRITGNLFRSIPEVSPTTLSKTATRVEVAVGSSAEYARRLELGFMGMDSRGRYYHQGPRSFLRPALDENTEQIEAEVKKKLMQIIERYIR